MLNWHEYIPLINTFLIFIAIPIISGLWRIRKEDLESIDRRLTRLEKKMDRAFLKIKECEDIDEDK